MSAPCPEHLNPYLANLTLRVCLAARTREEAEAAFSELLRPLDGLEAEERTVFVSARPKLPRAEAPVIQATALPGGGVKVAANPRVKRLRGDE